MSKKALIIKNVFKKYCLFDLTVIGWEISNGVRMNFEPKATH